VSKKAEELEIRGDNAKVNRKYSKQKQIKQTKS